MDIDKTTGLSFSEAFNLVRFGEGIRLPHWSPEAHIMVKVPFNGTDMTHPYLYVQSRFGTVPWKITNPELFSYDWELYKEDE